MVNTVIKYKPDLGEKISLMQRDARFDVADGDASFVPDLSFIRDGIRSKSPPKTSPKIFLSNNCIFNCAYCGCRSGKDSARRYTNAPKELAQIAVDTARAKDHGIFITWLYVKTRITQWSL